MKGGYKIIDFKNVSLSGAPVTMTDVLVDLLNNYEKVVLLSHVVLSGSAKDDCFSTVLSDGAGGVKLNCYDGYISINSSGAVTYTVASASGMAGDIEDLQSDLAGTNKMIASEWSETAVYTRNQPVIYNGKLYIVKDSVYTVPAGTLPTDTDYWSVFEIASGLKNILNRSFEIIKSISDFERVKSDLLTDQVTFCCMSQGIMNNVFGEQVFTYGFVVNFDPNTMRFYLFSTSYIFTGGYNIANGTWSNLTKTPLTTYTP